MRNLVNREQPGGRETTTTKACSGVRRFQGTVCRSLRPSHSVQCGWTASLSEMRLNSTLENEKTLGKGNWKGRKLQV